MENPAKTALVLGGGAPNATLMAGALLAFLDHKVQFDIISTSGAGALIGLLYLVPRGKSPAEALKATPNYGISDLLYNGFPVNYKVFQKSWPFSNYDTLVQSWLKYNPFYSANPKNPYQRLMNDWLLLMASLWKPTDLTYWSKGLCANVPFIEQVIDFEALRNVREEFYINAYNIRTREMECFDKSEITAAHFRAAMAYPFIYPPVEINGDFYIEGATKDCLNFKNLLNSKDASGKLVPRNDIKTIVVFDVLGAEQLIHVPNDLWDAYNISIITPLVEIAMDDIKIFEAEHLRKYPGLDLFKVDFYGDLQEEADRVFAHALDWSFDNLQKLFELGYQAGERFCQRYWKDGRFLHAPEAAAEWPLVTTEVAG